MTEPLADRIKDIARQIRGEVGGDDDTTRRSTFNILYDIGVEVAALTAANRELTFAFNLAGETCRKLEAERDALRDACKMAFEDLEQYEDTDIPGGYAVMETVQTLRAALNYNYKEQTNNDRPN